MIYFGCINGPGHYFHPDPARPWHRTHATHGPWPLVDGELVPLSNQAQSVGFVTHRCGWTALAVSDYTVDDRPGSNSVFMINEDLDSFSVVERAELEWATVYRRITDAAPIRILKVRHD